jgi:hypothetical protein
MSSTPEPDPSTSAGSPAARSAATTTPSTLPVASILSDEAGRHRDEDGRCGLDWQPWPCASARGADRPHHLRGMRDDPADGEGQHGGSLLQRFVDVLRGGLPTSPRPSQGGGRGAADDGLHYQWLIVASHPGHDREVKLYGPTEYEHLARQEYAACRPGVSDTGLRDFRLKRRQVGEWEEVDA